MVHHNVEPLLMSSATSQPVSERARTKIVATVGPACSTEEKIGELIAAGVDVFRMNMAHGDRQQHDQIVANIRAAASRQERPIGILVDLAGPKIRLGTLVEDPLECVMGARLDFVAGTESKQPDELTTNYDRLLDELSVGDRVLLADGTIGLRVTATSPDRVQCEVVGPGPLRSRQGVNLPGVKLSLPSITERDRQNAAWAAEQNVDFVSLSFVRSPDEIIELKSMLRDLGSEAITIAKIEKPEALDCLDEIVHASGGIMVARGDLGVEIDIERTPVEQKRIIDCCTTHRRPVIVATQMLDSMQESRRPTRAEASDVANAILDGADACMLSGETAIGKYPTESVAVMNRIMLVTEQRLAHMPPPNREQLPLKSDVHPVTEAVVYGAAKIADRLKAKVVVIQTHSGRTALTKAKQRDSIVTIAVSDREQTLRQMSLFWGIEPVVGAPVGGSELREFVDQWGLENNVLQSGDLVVLMASGDFHSGAHNQILVHEVS